MWTLHPEHQRYLCIVASIWGGWPQQLCYAQQSGWCRFSLCVSERERRRCRQWGRQPWTEDYMSFMLCCLHMSGLAKVYTCCEWWQRSQHSSCAGHQMEKDPLKSTKKCQGSKHCMSLSSLQKNVQICNSSLSSKCPNLSLRNSFLFIPLSLLSSFPLGQHLNSLLVF